MKDNTKPKHIEDRLEAIEDKLDRVLIALGDGKQRMNIQDIADMCKVSRQSLYTTKRYLLPDFGEGLKEGRKYTRSEVIAWLSKGENELYEEWKSCDRGA